MSKSNSTKKTSQKNGGEILKVEPWGKLSLAYKIEKFSEGIYVLIQFKADTVYVAELEKRYRYNESVIRSVVVMIDEKKFKLNPKREAPRKDRRRTEEGEFQEIDESTEAAETAEEVGELAGENVIEEEV